MQIRGDTYPRFSPQFRSDEENDFLCQSWAKEFLCMGDDNEYV
jgi:hypothetical protein